MHSQKIEGAVMNSFFKKEVLPIVTNRLLLRIPDTEETAWLLTYYSENRNHLEPWEPKRVPEFYSNEYWKKEIIMMNNQFMIGEALRLAFFLKSSPPGPVIGVCNFTNIMRGCLQGCFLGYSLDYRYQGNGYMYEALDAAIHFLFNRYKLHRVMASYIPRNERSGRLLRRLGFEVEGYSRDYMKINGKWEDHILTSRINNQV